MTRCDFMWFNICRRLSLIAAIGVVATSVGIANAQETYTHKNYRVGGYKITIFSKPEDNSGGSIRIVPGMKNTLWFPEGALGTIVSFTLKGVATAFTVPGGTANSLAEGSNNRMWFTEFNTDKVGSVSSAGKFKLYDTTDSPTKSNQMVLASDGNVWFATDNDGIGRTTPKGKSTFFSISNNAFQPTAVTMGPNNEIWFAEWAGPNVGYVTTNGTVKEFSAGFGSNSNTFGIAYGSDGRIWFCDPQNTRIGAINTDGSGLTSYSAGLTGQADSIVAGPDGNLYFGEFNGAVGRITTTGKIKELPLPQTEGSFPVLGITVGPDNNIWFSNNAHAQIGRLKIK